MITIQPERLRDFSGGVNFRDSPLGLGPTDLLRLENAYPLAAGAIIGRGGQTEYNAVAIDANPIRSLYRFYPQVGSGILIATSGSKVYSGNDGVGIFTEIDGGYTHGQKFSFASWSAKDKVYWINDNEVLKSFDGTTVATVAGTPPLGKMVELHKDRLWILLDDFVGFSDLNVDNVWPATSLLNISDNKGSTGSFIKSANDVLIIGKDTGLWRYAGSPLLGGDLAKYSDIGCVAPWSADVVTALVDGQVVPTGVMFLGAHGVFFTNGYEVTRLSGKIDSEPSGIFTAMFRGAVGKYYPKKQQYWLSYNAAGGDADTLWVATKLDRPDGTTAVSWSQYTGHNIESFVVWDGGSDIGQIYGGLSTDGKVRRLDFGNQDIETDYRALFTSRWLDFGDSGVNKSIRWIKSVFSAEGPVTYAIQCFDETGQSGSLDAATLAGMVWDNDNWDSAVWAGGAINNTRTSTLFSGQGRLANVTVFNIGDGPDFKFDELYLEARIKERRHHELFSLYHDQSGV